MNRIAAIFLSLGLSTPALAARHEVSFVFQGSFQESSRQAAWFDAYATPSLGLSGGYAVLQDRSRMGLVIDAGWVHARTGGEVAIVDDLGSQEVFTSLATEQFTVGLKGDVDVANIWYPYVHVQAGVVAAFAQLDDDGGDPENVNQIRANGVVPVGIFSAGFELMLPDRKLGWPLTAALFFEGGYRVAGPLSLGDLGGAMDLSGPVVRVGFGLRI